LDIKKCERGNSITNRRLVNDPIASWTYVTSQCHSVLSLNWTVSQKNLWVWLCCRVWQIFATAFDQFYPINIIR